VLVALLVALLGARLRDLRAVTPEARFLGDRIFGDRILGDRILGDPVRRRERDFPAMIPLSLGALTMPRPGSASHAKARFSPCERLRQSRRRSGQANQPANVSRSRAGIAKRTQRGGLGRF
jgi:hypothetical protein